jgi:probable lipoprotein NlpC
MHKLFLIPVFAAFLLTGCAGSSNVRTVPEDRPAMRPAEPVHEYTAPVVVVRAETLHAGIESWLGTPHRWGGNDRRGADCSGFVKSLYDELFGVSLPRTTSDQVHVGQPVRPEALVPGDLVFFKPPKTQHVGVYLGNNRFVHASTSRGVMVSALSERYWQRHYWTARRILPEDVSAEPRPHIARERVPQQVAPQPAAPPPGPPRRRGGW